MGVTVSIDRVSKAFGSGASRAAAVDGVSLEIAAGELFFLLGPSGCGKTTLLRMIAGFTEPDGGTIRFDGRDVTRAAPNRRNTGMVFQSYALWPHMTVAGNVGFGLRVRRVPKAERAARVGEALAAVRMEGLAARRPNQLSGGQQQRVALARALVVRPDVLLLDEPLSNLDARLRHDLRREIRAICKSFGGGSGGVTGVYVTHDQKEALSMADRIAIMDRGRIVQIGTPVQVYRRPATRFVAEFLGETNLVPGRITSRVGGIGTVETPLGVLRSGEPEADAGDAPRPAAAGEGRVLCSIRPEALRVLAGEGAATSGASVIRATAAEAEYLGEAATLTVRAGEHSLRVTVPNPSPATPLSGTIRLAVDAADVVLLPAE